MTVELAGLYMDVFNDAPWNDRWQPEQARKRLQDIIDTPGFYGIAEVADGKPIGMVMGRAEQYYDGLHFLISEFCVIGNMQGQGVGTGILKIMMQKLKSMGIIKCYLITSHGHRTEGFYQKNGFKVIDMMCVMSRPL